MEPRAQVSMGFRRSSIFFVQHLWRLGIFLDATDNSRSARLIQMPSRCLASDILIDISYDTSHTTKGGRLMFARHHGYWARGGCRPSFGSWAPRSRFFGPGEVRLAILSLLTDGPRHGYELMKMLAQRSGGIYRASAGTVYPTL